MSEKELKQATMIIGITGTIGAGKGTVVERLKDLGFRHFSVRDFLADEVRKRGMVLNRDALVAVANDLRAQHGSAYILETLFALAQSAGGNVVIESIRTLGEAAVLKGKPAMILLAVDADPKLRYERLRARASETDAVSWEQFLADEAREMENTDPSRQNLKACIEQADALLLNNGSKEELFAEVDRVIREQTERA